MTGTKLTAIRKNHISVECRCRRVVLIPVEYLIENLSGEHTVDDILPNLRCAQCGAKGAIQSCQIIHVGNSGIAMNGAEQKKREGDTLIVD